MSIQIAAAGNGINMSPLQELPQDRGSTLQSRARAAEVKNAALKKFTASLPGNDSEPRRGGDIHSTVEDLERLSLIFNRKLRFHIDHESHEVIVKVIDSETDKVIKVLPPEELQRLHRRVKEAIGFLFDEQV
ncbi:MAG: flagellar protein FlaG [Treponema sp.]|jgi:flagellar protein FlaG|nr:flagellar protein FlaG [Treponema sp.]